MATNNASTGIKNGGLVAVAAAVPALLMMSHITGPKVTSTTTDPSEIKVATCTSNIKSIQDCHDKFPAGCTAAAKPSYDAYLNYMKDRVPDVELLKQPVNLEPNDFTELDNKTPAKLSTHNHAEFADELKEMGEGGVRSIVAYLYFSKPNPGESSNCQLPNAKDGDFHVLIGFNKEEVADKMKGKSAVPKELQRKLDENAIIVEMTPYVRQSQQHTGWDLAVLKQHWGDKVKVVGQLMIDNEHNLKSANCALETNPDTSKCWRSTVWELHPVMEFYVCNKGDTCTADSDEGWVALDKMQ